MKQVDGIVGGVMKSLDEAGVTNETLVIYTSDNGSFMYRYDEPRDDHVTDETIQGYLATSHTANGRFRGTKADIWEAGHHVPFLVRWPKVVQAGSTCDKTICLTDFFATAAEVAGAEIDHNKTKGVAPDSFSLMSLFHGKDWSTPRAPVIHHSAGGMFAIREGQWKLVLGNGSGGREQPRGKPFERPYKLYNLKTDISETQNVIDEHPDIAAKLEKQLLTIRDSGGSRP